MRSAPAVTYPLGPASLRVLALALPWLLAAAASALWAAHTGAPRLAAGLALGCLLMAGLAGWLAQRSGRDARLCWDGRQWILQQPGGEHSGTLRLVLDGQALLLLAWQRPAAPTRWLWLHRAADPLRWSELRRAVYASARRGQPDAATQAEPAP